MTSQRGLLACLVAAVSLVAAAPFWDEQREFEHAVKDLTEEQVTLATAVAADVETRLGRLEDAAPTPLAARVRRRIGGNKR